MGELYFPGRSEQPERAFLPGQLPSDQPLRIRACAPHFPQPAQQVATLRVDEADQVGERALRGGDELHVELGEVGPCYEAPFSSRASVTYIWASLMPSATGPSGPGQTRPQLVPVGRLLRQHRQHDFLLHAPTSLNSSVP